MATIQIRNLSDAAVRTFKVRAAGSGQSLQQYMLAELESIAQRPTKAELIAQIELELEGTPRAPRRSSAEIIRELRDEREAHLGQLASEQKNK